jgi:sulfur relay (sulfurtransferase) DsrC/TusE family protein
MNRNEQGFVLNEWDWNIDYMYTMAQEDGVVLTPDMISCIETVRELYHLADDQMPTIDDFLEKLELDDFDFVKETFVKVGDPAKVIPMYGGLPMAMQWSTNIGHVISD